MELRDMGNIMRTVQPQTVVPALTSVDPVAEFVKFVCFQHGWIGFGPDNDTGKSIPDQAAVERGLLPLRFQIDSQFIVFWNGILIPGQGIAAEPVQDLPDGVKTADGIAAGQNQFLPFRPDHPLFRLELAAIDFVFRGKRGLADINQLVPGRFRFRHDFEIGTGHPAQIRFQVIGGLLFESFGLVRQHDPVCGFTFCRKSEL